MRACPKPAKREKVAQRIDIKRVSDKARASGELLPNSTFKRKPAAKADAPSRAPLSSRTTGIAKTAKPKRKPRTKDEALRIYGPEAFRDWLHQQPCAVSGIRGDIEQVHVIGGGMSRKADWTYTVPMARELHRQLHRVGIATFEAKHGVSLLALAEHTQQQYARIARAWGAGGERV